MVPPLRRALLALVLAALAALVSLALWAALHAPQAAPDVAPRVAGLAYNAFGRHDDPLAGRLPGEARIDADLQQLAQLTTRLRTYSASEFPALPALAQRHGLELALGVWLDRRAENNRRELDAAIAAARAHRNVRRVIAGNETRLHGSLSAAELRAALRRLRAALDVPVSTAEPWHVWLREPQLAAEVDFITVHLLPYWEGVPVDGAIDEALRRYEQLRARFPGKPIVIGEIGWPSHGAPVKSALPELAQVPAAQARPDAQALFVRRFLARAAALAQAGEPLDYYLMEAIDQPWKHATEGVVGAHWGLLDAERRPKFAFAGAVRGDSTWRARAWLASLLGAAALVPLLWAFATLRPAGRIALAAGVMALASALVVALTLPFVDYLTPLQWAGLLLLAPALLLAAAILLVQWVEFAEMRWPAGLRQRLAPRPWAEGAPTPFVSIHLACCNEPPQQVIATIDSLRALDWPAFELLVIDNNTGDERLWRPVAEHVQALQRGDGAARVRFVHLPEWPGFKAGALNHALQLTDARAEWVAVVDADYVVERGWLRQLAGWTAEPGVVAVQAPQAHRDATAGLLARMMNWEYEGFFRVGMHHRHERNALVQHGTMTLVRASALRAAHGWDEACVCEDTELGLRLLERGGRIIYVDQVYGRGLVPADFAAYARQRQRWAQGAMQILRGHVRELFGRSRLTLAQRYHFVAGWLPWIGDAAHLLFSLAAIGWTFAMWAAPQAVGPPHALLAVPALALCATRLVLTPLLYRRLVTRDVRDIAGAALAGMALSHRVARGVFAAWLRVPAVFHVTRKGRAAASRSAGVFAQVREETVLLLGLLGCLLYSASEAQQAALAQPYVAWMVALACQALPYAAALVCARLSGTAPQQPQRVSAAVQPAND
jgi:exo-beta-1,3-glucanase (GH17 family)